MTHAQTALATEQSYILGHAERELNRLIEQARFFGDLTAQVFQLAGLVPGMRVLDIGCGAGDVSFLAAGIVGPSGAVIGVDRSPEAVALANQRAAGAGLDNVHFVTQNIADLSLVADLIADEPFDALIGRLVLMYLGDPAVVLRRLAGFLRPGGVVAFHEMDMNGAQAEPACPLFETAVRRTIRAFTRGGIDTRTGLKLGRIFQEAGLPAPQMILGARVERGPDSPIYEVLAQISQTLLPLMERTGVVTAAEVGIETLADRLRSEAAALDATLVSPSLIGAWTHTATQEELR